MTYLTKRYASQVRAQVRKATAAAKGSNTASPTPGNDTAVPTPTHTRAPSSLSIRRDSPLPRTDGSGGGTPLGTSMRPILSRNTSGNTAGGQGSGVAGRAGKTPARTGDAASRRRLSSLPIATTPLEPPPQSTSSGPVASSSESESSDESSPAQSRIVRRPPVFHRQEGGLLFADDEDDENDAEPAFQPYKPPAQASAQDLGDTLKGDPRQAAARRGSKQTSKERARQSETSDSSTSSAAMVSISRDVSTPGSGTKLLGPLSPRRTTELAGKHKGKGVSREGSEGAPSMGSSFSDLEGKLPKLAGGGTTC